MMLSFDHPNVMSLIGMSLDGEVPLLIMPFMSGGSVLEFVTQSRENLHFTHGAAESEAWPNQSFREMHSYKPAH